MSLPPSDMHVSESAVSSSEFRGLKSFLREVHHPFDLLELLDVDLFVNPSDLFEVLACELRICAHRCDRSVSFGVFIADFYHSCAYQLPSAEAREQLEEACEIVILAAITHFTQAGFPPLAIAAGFRHFANIGPSAVVHAAFRSKFQEWRQMMQAIRHMPDAQHVDDSVDYGKVDRGALVADKVGNMLSHLRHLYWDLAFPLQRRVVEK